MSLLAEGEEKASEFSLFPGGVCDFQRQGCKLALEPFFLLLIIIIIIIVITFFILTHVSFYHFLLKLILCSGKDYHTTAVMG